MKLVYHYPQTLSEIFSIPLPEHVYYLAGGSDINVQTKNGLIKDGAIIHIQHLAELGFIEENDEFLRIGTTATISQILASRKCKKNAPILIKALTEFASPLIKNIATLGGNIANGSPTADAIPALLVLNAHLELIGFNGKRLVALRDWYTGYKQNILPAGELIAAVIINKNAQSTYLDFTCKIAARKSLSIGKVGIAALLKKENEIIKDMRIAVSSMSAFPMRLTGVEASLIGKDARAIDLAWLQTQLDKELIPITDMRSDADYRRVTNAKLILNFIKE